MTILLDALHAHAHTERRAVIEFSAEGTEVASISYHDLAARSQTIAAEIAEATVPESVVLLVLPNGIDFYAAFLGVLLSGRTVFPIQAMTRDSEVMQLARACHASLVITRRSGGYSLPVLDVSKCSGTHSYTTPSRLSALILQTSGTTGKPKLVLRESPSLDAVAQAVVHGLAITAADRVLIAIPLGHSYGLEHGVLAPVLAGATVCVLEEGAMPGALCRALSEHRVTILPGVPVLFEALSRSPPGNDHTLRLAYSAGSRLAPQIARSFCSTWGIHIGQIYGSSDVGSVLFADPNSRVFDESTVGLPLDAVSVRILSENDPTTALSTGEEGLIAIRAPSMLSRYVTDHQLELVDGHLLTGDLGYLDVAGRLHLAGRLSLLLEVGGKKVSPEEVEDVIRQHPGVEDCAVTSIRISASISRLRAVIVPSTPGAPPSARDLRAFARKRLQPFKVPRGFVFVDTLPRSPIGKILRHEIA